MEPRQPDARTPSSAQGGFTLIELLVVLTVLGIMMGIGVPSFRTFVNGQRVKSAATELMTTALIARSEAVKRNGTVTVAPVTASAWTGGWSAAVTAGGTLLHQQEALQNLTITTYTDSACTTAGNVSSVVFGSTGRASASSCFKFASDSTTTTRCVKLDLSGIPASGACP